SHQHSHHAQRRHHTEADLDPDSIGNRVDYKPKGKHAANYFYQGDIITGDSQPVYEGLPRDEGAEGEMSEEDRRAFERAQALQDNAIARMSQQGGSFVPGKAQGQMRTGEGRGRDRDGGRRGRRGRRGGRGRPDRPERNDHRGGGHRDDRGNRDPSGSGNSGGGGSSGGGSGGGNDSGGGDFSQPPV
ncbi:MAG: hypothetical protein ACK5QT_05905, partial [Oligoflexia bacterium]